MTGAAEGQRGDLKDLLAGLLLLAAGLAAGAYVLSHYRLGTVSRMGPGMFPLLVCGALVLFGCLTLLSAARAPRKGWTGGIDWIALAAVGAGMSGFAILFPLFGAAPAIAVLSILSGLAIRRSPLEILLLAASLILAAWLIFRLGLSISFPMFRLP